MAAVKAQLTALLGEDRYLDSPEDVISYSYDSYVVETAPDAVVFPQTVEEVSQVLALANRERIPVTARGAGTNLSGGSVPIRKGLVLSFTKMNRIVEVNTRDRYAIVQPGVVNYDLQFELGKQGFFFPPDPSSYMVSTIGGNIAENAGGPRCLKYGVTADYILSLEVVMATGKILRFGSRNIKDVTGYKLSSLFCGSEGTLGIVTEATLRVVPLPEVTRTILAYFDDLEKTADTVTDIIGSGILPAAMELMDHMTINVVEDAARLGLPRDAQGMLLIDVDGFEEVVVKQIQQIKEKAFANGASDVKIATSQSESDEFWKARRSAYSIFCRLAPNDIVEDATVPPSKIPKMVSGIQAIGKKHNLRVGILAHAGDGNMHPQILTDTRDKDEWQRVESAIREIFELAVRLGGTLSGEHGIGLAKAAHLHLNLNDDTREFMAQIKNVADPNGILNPGKFI